MLVVITVVFWVQFSARLQVSSYAAVKQGAGRGPLPFCWGFCSTCPSLCSPVSVGWDHCSGGEAPCYPVPSCFPFISAEIPALLSASYIVLLHFHKYKQAWDVPNLELPVLGNTSV